MSILVYVADVTSSWEPLPNDTATPLIKNIANTASLEMVNSGRSTPPDAPTFGASLASPIAATSPNISQLNIRKAAMGFVLSSNLVVARGHPDV